MQFKYMLGRRLDGKNSEGGTVRGQTEEQGSETIFLKRLWLVGLPLSRRAGEGEG